MAQNVKKVASKNLKKPKVAENSKSCQNSKKLPKISKVAEKLPSNLWLSLLVANRVFRLKRSTAGTFAMPFRILSRKKMTGDNVLCKNGYLLWEKQFQATPTKQDLGIS